MHIRPCEASDAKAICDIYNHYIKNSIATFEEQLLTSDNIAKRITTYTKNYPWLVLEDAHGVIIGYAYATNWAERSAFKHTVEITVYLHHEQAGHGYASALYKRLLPLLAASGFHVVVAAISLPNEGSIKLHESFSFQQVAHFKQVGYKFDRWIDVVHWQLIL